MLAKVSEHFFDVFAMICGIVRINEDVVKIDDDRNINHVWKDIIHEPLERGGSIDQPFQDNQPFEQAIVCAECCFLFIPIGYPDQMVPMSKINLCINASPAGSIKEIRDKWKGVAVFL